MQCQQCKKELPKQFIVMSETCAICLEKMIGNRADRERFYLVKLEELRSAVDAFAMELRVMDS